jgi:predicted nucleic acid-binding protein
MNAVFVDTNVLVYARDASEPHKQRLAAQWVTRLWREQTGRTSMQVLNEYYVTLTRKLKPGLKADEGWDDVMLFLAWTPQIVDRELLLSAREIERRYGLSWWDSMIVSAARLQECATLLTEDLQDGMIFGSVTVRNPFAAGVAEDSAAYKILPAIPQRHRPRGRPRRVAAG